MILLGLVVPAKEIIVMMMEEPTSLARVPVMAQESVTTLLIVNCLEKRCAICPAGPGQRTQAG